MAKYKIELFVDIRGTYTVEVEAPSREEAVWAAEEACEDKPEQIRNMRIMRVEGMVCD